MSTNTDTLSVAEVAEAPASIGNCDNLTPGKRYPILRKPSDLMFVIVDDGGDEIPCLWEGCAFLSGDDWIRVPTLARDAS